MTNLPRFTIFLPMGIAEKVDAMKAAPEFSKTPKFKIIAFLIRQGMKCEENGKAPPGAGV